MSEKADEPRPTGACYTEDYRHFDNLIWQVPNWASATFALTATAAGVGAVNGDAFFAATGLPIKLSLGVFLSIVAAVLSLQWNVLFRFRIHQATVTIRASPFVKHYRFLPAGHTSIQAILGVEAASLFAVSFICFGVWLPLAFAIPAGAALVATIWADREIKNIKGKIKEVAARQPTSSGS